ncbi:MGMT family protein [Candidatus Woesearchaeota archaeon]|nr:MGMT family protein [Candidatus Woesearchaeota archaeon]
MNFNQKVYKITKKIPKGKVATYKQIAKHINSKAYRAVGNALNKNKNPRVPCHRVIKSNLEVGGFNKGTKQKIKLLKKEDIKIINNKISKKHLFLKKNI